MPFVDHSSNTLRRILINGAPGVGKTTSALTAPKPLGIVLFPGEKGWASIPHDDPEIIVKRWESDPLKPESSGHVVKTVTDLVMQMITGKFGHIHSFVGDGLHKLVDYFIDDVTGGDWFAGIEFKPALYSLAYRQFEGFLNRVAHSQIPVAIFTSWDGDKPDRKKRAGENASDVPTSLRAELPGKLARDIMGEFDIVFHQSLKVLKPGEAPLSVWQTQLDSNIASATIKGPRRITSRIPKFIRATYPAFEEEWAKADKASQEGAKA